MQGLEYMLDLIVILVILFGMYKPARATKSAILGRIDNTAHQPTEPVRNETANDSEATEDVYEITFGVEDGDKNTFSDRLPEEPTMATADISPAVEEQNTRLSEKEEDEECPFVPDPVNYRILGCYQPEAIVTEDTEEQTADFDVSKVSAKKAWKVCQMLGIQYQEGKKRLKVSVLRDRIQEYLSERPEAIAEVQQFVCAS